MLTCVQEAVGFQRDIIQQIFDTRSQRNTPSVGGTTMS